MRSFKIPLLITLVFSLSLGIALGVKLKRDRAARMGVVTSSRKLTILSLTGALPPSVLKGFRSAENIDVTLVEQPSPDALMKALETLPDVDLVTVLVSQIAPGLQQSRLQTLKADELAGFRLISRDYVDLPGHSANSVPFLWGVIGIASAGKNENTSWEDLLDDVPLGKIEVKPLDLEVARLAKIGLPQPYAEGALQDRIKRFSSQLKRASRFLVDPAEIPSKSEVEFQEMNAAELSLEPFKDRSFVLPDDGALLWILNFALGGHAKNVTEAKIFLSYILRPEVALEISSATHQASTNISVQRSNLDERLKPFYLRKIPLTKLKIDY